jgi:hypothetical protein
MLKVFLFKQLVSIPEVLRCNLSSKRKERHLNRINVNKVDNDNLPQFNDLLKSFYKKSHPDILRSVNSEFAVHNDNAYQQLNEVLSAIKDINTFPPQLHKSIHFHIKSDGNNITKVELLIRTGGGDCRKSLTTSFETFFMNAGINKGKFAWGNIYFPVEKI